MLKKTHMAVGATAALAIAQPKTIPLIATTVVASSVASLIPDSDTENGTAHKWAVSMAVIYVFAMVGVAIGDHMTNGALVSEFISKDNSDIVRIFIGITLTVISCVLGFFKHRWYTHSFFAAFVFSLGIYLIFPNHLFALAFFIGYVSHLIIDLPNYKECYLLWPFNKGFCFKICKSDGIVNALMFFIFTITALLQMVFLSPYGDEAKQLLITLLQNMN